MTAVAPVVKPVSKIQFENIQLTQIIPALVERAWQVGSVQALEELETMIAIGRG